MDIEYKGGNCIIATIKKTTIVLDPKISTLGLKDQGANAAVQLVTQPQFAAPHGEKTIVIDGPGEYEVDNISVRGVAAQAHMDGDGKRATMFAFEAEGISVATVGHIYPKLTEDQLEALGVVDVLVVPVGGNGYTLDAAGAIEVIRKIDPKIVIPTHYEDPQTKYEVPQASIDQFIKDLGAAVEVSSKLKLKAGMFGDVLTVQQLNRVA